MLGSYLSRGHWENLVIIVVFGILGYGLKRFRWPRPPFVIGLVLGPIAEHSLHKALALWGPAFMLRPISLILIAIIVGTLGLTLYRRRNGAPGHVG
jgi:TctA family transporter